MPTTPSTGEAWPEVGEGSQGQSCLAELQACSAAACASSPRPRALQILDCWLGCQPPLWHLVVAAGMYLQQVGESRSLT